jgi:Cu/Ag efflux pump CusA
MSSYVDLGFTVKGRDSRAVVRDIVAKLQGYAFPFEYHAEVLNNVLTQQAGTQRTLGTGLIALIGIFLLLQASVSSWRMAAAILFTLPAALAGGVLAAFVTNGTLSIAALFGLLPVLGITVRNTILLVREYQRIELEEGRSFNRELVLQGSGQRVAPTIMTALTTVLALLPLMIFGNIPGQEIVRPMAIIIVGGLITSTWLHLFALPALYLRFGTSREADLEFRRADLSPVASD